MANPKSPIVLITGASQGIGEAIAKVFAREVKQVRLVLVARSSRNLERVARGCLKAGARAAHVFTCDVSSETAVEALGNAVTREVGSPDVLVNNAGLFRAAPFLETSTQLFDEVIGTNLRSTFLVTRAFLPAMVKRRSGDVFNMSSIAGLGAYPHSAAYCAAKFGVTGLSQVLRQETQQSGVRVICVHPGATWSPSWKSSGVEESRIMPAEDIARAFLDIYRLSRTTVVEEIVLRPQLGDL